MNNIHIKRIYDDPSAEDGTRVLIDRLWPRGVSKKDAAIDHWAKPLAPTDDLREWFGHEAKKFAEFKKKYRAELKECRDEIKALLDQIDQRKRLTLLTATKDLEHCHAVVLKEYLEGM